MKFEVVVLWLLTVAAVTYPFSQTPRLTPFTATKVAKQYRSDTGELARSIETTFALKSNGSSVTLVRSAGPDGQVRDVKSVIDVESRRDTSLHGHTESISTTYLTEKHALSRRVPDTSCAVLAGAERKTLLGFDAVKVGKELPAPPGLAFRVENWQAPALNCLPLEQTFFQGPTGGPLRRVNFEEVTNVVVGDPDPSLFEIPAGFQERSPSQVMEEYYRRYPTAKCATCTQHYDKIDASYYAQQQRRASAASKR